METPLPDPIRNRVDESGLIALDLDQLAPKANVRSLDLSAYLEPVSYTHLTLPTNREV